jgi:hypothetical protein
LRVTTTKGFLDFGILLPGRLELPHFRTKDRNPPPPSRAGLPWKYPGVAKRHYLPFFCQAFRPL